MDKAWAVGREGSIFKRLSDVRATQSEPVRFNTQLIYDVSELRDEIESIGQELYVAPVDATIAFHQGEDPLFTITPEQVGRQLKVDETITQLMERVDNRQYGEMTLPIEELTPARYESEVETWTDKIASFRTLLHENTDRTYNVTLSSGAYDGLVLEPGEVFSLNDTTGPRDKAHGYRDADVIVGGKKLEPAPGGGNCQTATTPCTVRQYGPIWRSWSGIPTPSPPRIPKWGMDATVNYPYADIKIKNNKEAPLFFDRYFDGDWICVDIYGKTPEEYDQIKMDTVILKEGELPEPTMVADSSLRVGVKEEEYKSRRYIKCETYRVYYKDGEEIKRTFEATSVYPQGGWGAYPGGYPAARRDRGEPRAGAQSRSRRRPLLRYSKGRVILLRPFLLHPVYMEKPWGGDALRRLFGRSQPYPLTGESWELSCHPHGASIVADGPYAGLPLTEVLDKDREALLGERDASLDRFPLLIKFLDIQDLLSVQVHPDDTYAFAHEQGDPGKTEAWYILEAGPDACVYMGLNPGVDRLQMERAIREGTLSDMMRRVPVQKGDLIFIAAGTVHTAKDVFLCEVQQNSDTTYRVYDWQRVAPDGTSRPLHIPKALNVTDFSGRPVLPVRGLSHRGEGYVRTLYASCPYFTMEDIRIDTAYSDDTLGTGFHSLSLVEGEGSLLWQDTRIPVALGQTVFIPASAGAYTLTGKGVWVKAYRPSAQDVRALLDSWGVSDPGEQVAGL